MSTLYLARNTTGLVWDPPAKHQNLNQKLDDVEPRRSPKAVYNHVDAKIYLAWKNPSDSTTISYSQIDPKNPELKPTIIQDAQCEQSPSLAVFNGELLLLYKGLDQQTWCHTWNADMSKFADAVTIKKIPRNQYQGLFSTAVLGAELHIIFNDYATGRIHGFKGTRKDTDFSELASFNDSAEDSTYEPVSSVPYQGFLHVFYSTVNLNHPFCAIYDGKAWLGGFEIPLRNDEDWDHFQMAPDVFVHNSLLYITYRRGYDLWFQTYDGNSFSPRNVMTGVDADGDKAVLIPATVSTPEDGIFTFYARRT